MRGIRKLDARVRFMCVPDTSKKGLDVRRWLGRRFEMKVERRAAGLDWNRRALLRVNGAAPSFAKWTI